MSWKTNPLGKITNILSGTTPDSSNPFYWGGSHVWITPTDLGKLDSVTICESGRKITDQGVSSCNLSIVPKKAIVMSSRAPIGHLAISGCDLYTNQGCKSFVCGDMLDPEFLYFTLKHRMAEIQALGSGATFVEVSKSALQDFVVSYPVLTVQRRIASRLKAQLAAVEEARNAAQAQLAEANLLATRLKEQALAKLNGIVRVPLGRLLTGIETGKSFQTTDRLAIDTELGVLKVSAVSWGVFQPHEAKAIEGNYVPQDHHRIYKEDLLISRANTVDLVGAVVRVDQDYPNRLLSDKTLRLLIDESQVLPNFLLHILRMPEARKHIEANATGTSDSMRNISQETIRSIPVVLPDIKAQREIAEHLEQVDTTLNELSLAIKAQLKEINLLPSKILAKAFDFAE